MRRVISPYSVNSVALACIPVALNDRAYLDGYVEEVIAARAEFEMTLDSLGIRRWSSQANFILVNIGKKHAEFVQAMSAGGVLVRDRSNDPGCNGCVRITIGTRDQMLHAAQVLNDVIARLREPREANA
jgi:histidinol-phosphate aminotransferase